jgi:hypothetical protein
MRHKTSGGVILFVCLLGACLPLPATAQGVGAIGGTLTDPSGAVLPGVIVTLVSPGTVGGNQEVATNERGTYQFTRLVPGRYGVKAELSGFRRAVQDAVVVIADVTSRVDLQLEVGQLEEGIIVSGQAPLLDTTSALKQTSIPREVLDTLPNRVDVWSIVKIVPSVNLNKVDVGGSESFLQSVTTVHGTSNENSYMVDGMDTSASVGVGTQISMYPDPYLLQEVNYQLGNGSAEVSQGGVVFNQITKTGTNTLHGGGMFSGATHGMGSSNTSPELRAQLLATVPPKVLAVNPDIVPGADIQHIYDSGAWLGGPIFRDKLWFLGTAHTQVLKQYILGSYDPDGNQVVDDNVMWNVAAKVSWQANRSNQLSYFYNLQYKLIRYRNDDNSFVETRARNYNYKYPSINQLKWTSLFGSRLAADVSGSLSITPVDAFRPQPEVNEGDIARFDSVQNTITVARPVYNDPKYFRSVVLASLSYYRSSHSLKAGYQFNRSYATTDAYSLSGGVRAVFRNGVPDSVNTYNTPVNYAQYNNDHAVYIQDRWTPHKKLTLNLGLRYESFYGYQPAACQPQTQWVAGHCFPAIEGAPDFNGVVPRISAVYDVFGNGRTAVKIAANRYYMPQGISLITRINPLVVTNDTRSWRDSNGDLTPQIGELGPSTGFNLGTTNRFSPDLEWPLAREYSVELQHQLPGGIVVTAAYVRRETRRNIGSENLAVPESTYIPLQVTEATSGRQVTVYNQDPSTRGKFDVLFDNYDDLDTDFDGVDLTVQRRLSNGWMLSGGASFGKAMGDIYCVVAYVSACSSVLNNPNFTYRSGVVGNDTPYAIRMSGIYVFPYQLWVSATAQRNSGFPENTTVLVGSNTVALTQVSQSLLVEPRATTRLPPLNSIDISVKRPFRRGAVSIEPRVDFYNLTNNATVLGRITQLGPSYGRVNSIQRGRLIKAGFNVDF